MVIIDKLIRKNYSDRKGESIKYIVIHDTGNPNKGADAEAHYQLFDREDRGASAHYFVDDNKIIRTVRDSEKSWHCGDGYGKYDITNENSIGVEMCINSDGNFSKTYENTLQLVKYLMGKYNIPIDRVVRHYDASRKCCPNIWSENNWEKWNKFKTALKTSSQKDYKITIQKVYNNVFQREADHEGLNYWNKQLNSGLTFGDMLKSMGESEEFREKYLV